MKKYQAGLLIPWVNIAMEEEMPILTDPEIGLHWSRLKPSSLPLDGHDESYLERMDASVPDALSKFAGLKLDVLVLGCTSMNFKQQMNNYWHNSAQSATIGISAFEAIIIQLQKARAKRIKLFAPYSWPLIEAEVNALKQNGIDVIKATQIEYNNEIRFIQPEQICNLLNKEDFSECNAALISCTGLYTIEAIKEFREISGSNATILSSNMAIAACINDIFRKNTP